MTTWRTDLDILRANIATPPEHACNCDHGQRAETEHAAHCLRYRAAEGRVLVDTAFERLSDYIEQLERTLAESDATALRLAVQYAEHVIGEAQ